MHIKITVRYYFKPKTMAKITIPNIDENIDQLKLLHIAAENVNYRTI